MYKALIKKQLLEMLSFLFKDNKKHKRRSTASIVLLSLLLLYSCGTFFFLFVMLSLAFCQPLVSAGSGWLYFALMGTLATALGVIGSVFSTYSTLYRAKDNELLLSLPLPPRAILFSRMAGLYLFCLFFEAMVLIPTFAVYLVQYFSVFSLLAALITLLIAPLFALAVCCILGYLIAIIAARLGSRIRGIVTMVVSLSYILLYFFIQSKIQNFFQSFLENSEELSGTFKTFLYPFYCMGLGLQGDALSALVFIAITLALFGAVYILLSKSFIGIITSNRGDKKRVYKEKSYKTKSSFSALLRKELHRFTTSPAYMLNGALASIFLIIAAVFVLVKGDALTSLIAPMAQHSALICAAAIVLLSSMNLITAPSISLESKTLWLLQSLPVSPWQILKAKLALHILLTAVPALICIFCIAIALKLDVLSMILTILATTVFIVLCAAFGLILNLKIPNLEWVNETAAVKQGLAVLFAMFGGWAMSFFLIGLGFLLVPIVGQTPFFLIAIVIICALCVVSLTWLKTKGTKVFMEL